MHDLRYSLRSLLRSPGWTAAAVLTLALGVGANTTVFSWVNAVLLDPIPGTSEPSRLRVLYGTSKSGDAISLSYPVYREIAARTDAFSGVVAQRAVALALGARTGEPPQRIWGAVVSGGSFEVLGVRPLLGRFFRPEEDAGPGSPPVVVLSESLWSRHFGSDPAIVGKSVPINGAPFTVVGVAPADFIGSLLGLSTDLWAPLAQSPRLEPGGGRLEDRGDRWLTSVARLAPGVDEARANRALEVEAARIGREDGYEGYGFRVAALSKSPWGGPLVLRPVLLTLLALVGLVLLTACANVSALLLSRAVGRRREIAVRMAIGAGRGRIVRQLSTESLLLAALGGLAAVVLTFWTSGLLLSFIPPSGRPIRLDLAVDGRVLAFAFAAASVSSVLFGLLPALRASRSSLVADLAGEFGAIGGARGRSRLRQGLVVAQVALSLILLVAAGLFLRSFVGAQNLDPGFGARKALIVGIDVFPLGYSKDRGRLLFDELVERAGALPGVESAAVTRRVPLGFSGSSSSSFEIEGYTPAPGEELMAKYINVGPGYFRTLQIGLRGREFEPADREGAPPVAIVNETFVRRYFPNGDALGKQFGFFGERRTIIGVARDGRFQTFTEKPAPFLYVPLGQLYRPTVALVLRTSGDPGRLLPAVRGILGELDPNLPVGETQTMEQHILEALIAQRIGSSLLGLLGLLAGAIAGVGLYGVAAHAVAERRREFGVRMALGANPTAILRGVLAHGMRLTAMGVGLGLGGAFAISRLLASQLPGVSPTDPVVFGGMAITLASIALLATWLPARQASRLDPMTALKAE